MSGPGLQGRASSGAWGGSAPGRPSPPTPGMEGEEGEEAAGRQDPEAHRVQEALGVGPWMEVQPLFARARVL